VTYVLDDRHLDEQFSPPAGLSARTRPDTLGLAAVLGSDRDCSCGADSTSWAAHAKQHMRWARGVPVAPAADLARVCQATGLDSLLPVPQSASAPLRRLAYDVGLLFRRENRYDFPPLPWPGRGGMAWTDDPTAYLAVWEDRAIALVVLHTVERFGLHDRPDEKGYIQLDQPGPVRGVAAVFVCADYRRRGIASRLVRAACAAEDHALEDLAWSLPFSPGGAALARTLVAADGLRVSA